MSEFTSRQEPTSVIWRISVPASGGGHSTGKPHPTNQGDRGPPALPSDDEAAITDAQHGADPWPWCGE